jgi:hypothetical protein
VGLVHLLAVMAGQAADVVGVDLLIKTDAGAVMLVE